MTRTLQQLSFTIQPSVALINAADFDSRYLGAFRVPEEDIAASTFAWGGGAAGFNENNNSLFLVGHIQQQQVGEISIPTIINSLNVNDLQRAVVLQPFRDLLIQAPSPLNDINGVYIGGLMVENDRLVGTAYLYYDGGGNTLISHFLLSSTDLALATVSGLFQVGNLGGGYVGGYIVQIPPEWQQQLGASYFTGQAAISIISRTSLGPAAFGFDINDLGVDIAPMISYVYYPIENPTLGDYESNNSFFNGTTSIVGGVFVPNTRSVLFFGSHGMGDFCYGGSVECNDPVIPYQGTHSIGGIYAYRIWAYDVLDFIDVRNGVRQPWEIVPYAVWEFDLPFATPSREIGGVAFDPVTGRLFISQVSSDGDVNWPYPLIHVYDLGV